jgi:ADP-ribosylglycohydrolase
MSQTKNEDSITRTSRIRGCLLGGAVGDALGAPVEFMPLAAIREAYGAHGVTGSEHTFRERFAITDDTQMTLFTAEGLIRAAHRSMSRGLCAPEMVLHNAYRRWMITQGFGWNQLPSYSPCSHDRSDSWLIREEVLHAKRAPGDTCMRSMLAKDAEKRGFAIGTTNRRINHSKGCGGVMRVAPIGLAAMNDPFRLGCDAAAITHGHPTGFLAAGAFAEMVFHVARSVALRKAAKLALEELRRHEGHEETSRAIEAALALAATRRKPTPELVETLGAGWIAEEALAIGLYCALVARNFSHGVLLAINHSGDSDSTGSICGNLLGAKLGEEAIPKEWLAVLEAREIIEQIADDLARLVAEKDYEPYYERYPPW